MIISDLMSRLQAQHYASPQEVQLVLSSLRDIESALNALTRLGHVYHLEPGPPYELPEWPRVLFHVTSAPNGRVVRSSWEAIELGYGWWPTLEEAQQKEGIKTQFRGRGGVNDRALPMVMDGGPPSPRFDPTLPSTPNNNGDIIKEWRERVRSAETSDVSRPTNGDARNDPSQGESEATVGEGIRRQSVMGDSRSSGSGTELGIQPDAELDTNRVSEDAIQGESISNSK